MRLRQNLPGLWCLATHLALGGIMGGSGRKPLLSLLQMNIMPPDVAGSCQLLFLSSGC